MDYGSHQYSLREFICRWVVVPVIWIIIAFS